MDAAPDGHCNAYEMLTKQIGQQCEIYQSLHQAGKLGCLPGMYDMVPEEKREIPASSTSAFLRGGIINTMACFETYLYDLLNEAETVISQRSDVKLPKDEFKYDVNTTKISPTLYSLADVYANRLLGITSTKEDFVSELIYVGELRHVSAQAKQSSGPNSPSPWLGADQLRQQAAGHQTRRPRSRSAPHDWSGKVQPQTDRPLTGASPSPSGRPGLAMPQNKSNPDPSPRQVKEMKYYYLIDSDYISKMNFTSENCYALLNIMLNFCHGIRCIMAHGNANETEMKALKDFPLDPKSQFNYSKVFTKKLKDIVELNKAFSECMQEPENLQKSEVLKTSRHIPRPDPLYKLAAKYPNELKIQGTCKKAKSILRQYFSDLMPNPWQNDAEYIFETCLFSQKSNDKKRSLNESYALYHMCRIHSYLVEPERNMYVTYRLLVRINQFILVIAHRMWITVGRILMYKYGLRDRTWGIQKNTQHQSEIINNFEEECRQKVQSLQKRPDLDRDWMHSAISKLTALLDHKCMQECSI